VVTRVLALPIALALVTGCTPAFDDRPSRVDGPRVLAIASVPAEGAPGDEVDLRALYVDEGGDRGGGELGWAFCVERKPLTELGPVSTGCLRASAPATTLVPLGDGLEVSGALPADGCRQFGPDRPEPVAGEPVGRPVDPDPSGGYYQPVRVRVAADGTEGYATGATRIACGLGGATPEVAADFTRRYRANANPAIDALALDGAPLTADDDGQPAATVAPGAEVTLEARWAACPEALVECAGAEQYLYFDPATRGLAVRREAIRVSWFATGGAFDADRTGRSGDERETASENRWRAPEEPGTVLIWAVIRDDRGGAGWRRYRVAVGP
jgi:hypothetical protein